MSAKVPDCLTLKELLKPTGYECLTDQRACCAMSGKLHGWYCAESGSLIYTTSPLPIAGEKFIYGLSNKGYILAEDFSPETEITAEKIVLDDSVYNRAVGQDIVL